MTSFNRGEWGFVCSCLSCRSVGCLVVWLYDCIARDGGAAQCDCEPVQETVELMHGGHIATGKGDSKEKGGVRTGGEGAEGTVDGDCERTRMGKERQMPYGVIGRFESVEREGSSESVL